MSNTENTTESRQARYMLSQHENGSFTLHPVSYSEVPFIGLPKSEELIGAYDTAEERQDALDRIKTSAHAEHAPALEYLRWRLRSENISTGELVHLASLSEYIDPGDVELLEAAGVPENVDTCGCCGKVLHDDEGGEVEGVGGQVSYRCDSCLSGENSCPFCGIGFDQELKPDEAGKCPHCFAYAGETTAASFTPGPWRIENWEYSNHRRTVQTIISGSGTDAVAQVCSLLRDQNDPHDISEESANARLIAAAPEMFELLVDLREWWTETVAADKDEEMPADLFNRHGELLAKIRNT